MNAPLASQSGTVKAALVAAATFLTAKFGVLFLPLLLLVVCNVADYIVGIFAAHHRGERVSSKKGFGGISKKISMWLLVVVGVVMDLLLDHLLLHFGWQPPFNLPVGSLVCVWLLINEIISILENADDIGLRLPSFLMRLVDWLKNMADFNGDGES